MKEGMHMNWARMSSREWRSRPTEEYVIRMRTDLPHPPGHKTPYELRWRETHTLRAWGPDWMGIPLCERETLDAVKVEAERHAWSRAHREQANLDLKAVPADASADFFWWVSDGTSPVRLILTRNEAGKRVARVVSMSRKDEDRFEPVTVVEIVIPPEADAEAAIHKAAVKLCEAHRGSPMCPAWPDHVEQARWEAGRT
jgi:hypothetical protein